MSLEHRTAVVAPIVMTILCLGGLPSGCAGGDDAAATWAGTIDTLPSGTVVVRNGREGIWPLDSRSGALDVDLRIGRASGEGPDVFGEVRDIDVDPLDRIYVLDSQAGEVRVFGADGSHLRTIARRGEGPGELQGPTGMEWGPGGRLWVEDTDNNRYSVFDTTGAHVASFPRKSNWFGYSWSGRFDDQGYLYLEQHQFSPEGRVDRLAKFDTTMTLLDTFALPSYDAPAYELVRNGRVRMAAAIPFSPHLLWTVAPDGTIWFGVSDEYRLYRRSLAGDTLRIVEREFEPIPVTAEERDSRLEAEFYQRMREQGADVDPGRVPEHHPAWNGFSVGPEGYLWVVPEGRDSLSTPLDVFDPEGRYLGRLVVAERILSRYPGPLVRGENLYGVTRDELGVPYVVRVPLGLPGAGR